MIAEMTWSSAEAAAIEPLAHLFETSDLPRRTPQPPVVALHARDVPPLLEGLYCEAWGVPVRQLMRALGFDEWRVLALRVEHKLQQALLLHRYCGEAMPATQGLDKFIVEAGIRDAAEVLPLDRMPDVVVKSAVGHGSEALREFDLRREQVGEAIQRCRAGGAAADLLGERLIVQERLDVEKEFRVHTIEDTVVPDLTHRRYATTTGLEERAEPVAFVQDMLRRLPDGLVAHTVTGWDVVRTRTGAWRICEINFTGYHTIFGRGFQCSGYYTDTQWGFARVIRLIAHIEATYGTRVDIDAEGCPNPDLSNLYTWIESGVRLLRERRAIEELARHVEQMSVPGMLGGPTNPPQGISYFKSYLGELRKVLAVLE